MVTGTTTADCLDLILTGESGHALRNLIDNRTPNCTAVVLEPGKSLVQRCYPVIFIDAVNVKIRDGKLSNRPIYVALAVTGDGHITALNAAFQASGLA